MGLGKVLSAVVEDVRWVGGRRMLELYLVLALSSHYLLGLSRQIDLDREIIEIFTRAVYIAMNWGNVHASCCASGYVYVICR